MLGSPLPAPNAAHHVLASWSLRFPRFTLITQNVDDLHERAGSTNVIHLHGSLFESRSTGDESLVYQMEGWELNLGDTCEKGHQLRPNIVWFGEMVPLIDTAIYHAAEADIFLVVGTSLVVYPAAGLIHYVPHQAIKYLVDVKIPPIAGIENLITIEAKASTGMEQVKDDLLKKVMKLQDP